LSHCSSVARDASSPLFDLCPADVPMEAPPIMPNDSLGGALDDAVASVRAGADAAWRQLDEARASVLQAADGEGAVVGQVAHALNQVVGYEKGLLRQLGGAALGVVSLEADALHLLSLPEWQNHADENRSRLVAVGNHPLLSFGSAGSAAQTQDQLPRLLEHVGNSYADAVQRWSDGAPGEAIGSAVGTTATWLVGALGMRWPAAAGAGARAASTSRSMAPTWSVTTKPSPAMLESPALRALPRQPRLSLSAGDGAVPRTPPSALFRTSQSAMRPSMFVEGSAAAIDSFEGSALTRVSPFDPLVFREPIQPTLCHVDSGEGSGGGKPSIPQTREQLQQLLMGNRSAWLSPLVTRETLAGVHRQLGDFVSLRAVARQTERQLVHSMPVRIQDKARELSDLQTALDKLGLYEKFLPVQQRFADAETAQAQMDFLHEVQTDLRLYQKLVRDAPQPSGEELAAQSWPQLPAIARLALSTSQLQQQLLPPDVPASLEEGPRREALLGVQAQLDACDLDLAGIRRQMAAHRAHGTPLAAADRQTMLDLNEARSLLTRYAQQLDEPLDFFAAPDAAVDIDFVHRIRAELRAYQHLLADANPGLAAMVAVTPRAPQRDDGADRWGLSELSPQARSPAQLRHLLPPGSAVPEPMSDEMLTTLREIDVNLRLFSIDLVDIRRQTAMHLERGAPFLPADQAEMVDRINQSTGLLWAHELTLPSLDETGDAAQVEAQQSLVEGVRLELELYQDLLMNSMAGLSMPVQGPATLPSGSSTDSLRIDWSLAPASKAGGAHSAHPVSTVLGVMERMGVNLTEMALRLRSPQTDAAAVIPRLEDAVRVATNHVPVSKLDRESRAQVLRVLDVLVISAKVKAVHAGTYDAGYKISPGATLADIRAGTFWSDSRLEMELRDRPAQFDRTKVRVPRLQEPLVRSILSEHRASPTAEFSGFAAVSGARARTPGAAAALAQDLVRVDSALKEARRFNVQVAQVIDGASFKREWNEVVAALSRYQQRAEQLLGQLHNLN
jgi:hypothetical protein